MTAEIADSHRVTPCGDHLQRMTDQHTADDDGIGSIGPITDHESLRGRDDVPFHEVTDVVDRETVEAVAELDDMAPVGVENDDGEVLVVRVTEDCAWKIPSAAVEPGADYAATARRWVAEQAGLDVSLDGIAGVWRFRLRAADGDEDDEDDGVAEATRTFVVFGASLPADDRPAPDARTGTIGDGSATAAGWFDELPADAEAVPGTDLFFE